VGADRIPPATPAESPKGYAFGEQLRRAREAQGVSIEAIAEATRISRLYLEALERSDLDVLPAGPFAKGYIEAYTRVLGIDSQPILETYRAREGQRGLGAAEDERRLLDEMSHLLKHRAEAKKRAALRLRPGHLALALLGLGVVGGLGWSLSRIRASRPAGTSPTPVARASAAAGAVPVPKPVPEPVRPTPAVAARSGETTRTPALVPSSQTLEVTDHGVGSGVVDRQLVGRSDQFPEGTTVTYSTLVIGGGRDHVIRHVWFQDGRAVARVDLPIGGPHWRTFSRLLLPQGSAGPWTVEARTSDGRLLARDEFLCESARP
jgi:cytoskeletal protein RodZ